MPVYNIVGGLRPAVDIMNFVVEVQMAPHGVSAGARPTFVGADRGDLVGTNGTRLVTFGQQPGRTTAFGIMTCAAVIYASTNPNFAGHAWLHHAGSGVVETSEVADARAALGNPPMASIVIVYAHPGPQHHGYTESIEWIVSCGVLANNIVEITDISGGLFGIDNLGRIGS